MTRHSPICYICNDQVSADYVDPETGVVGWCEECRCGVQPPPPNTHTNFNALRNMMRVVNEHKRFMASDAPIDQKELAEDFYLEWNKFWADDLTQFEWNIVKAHMPS